jgi:flagella basal body P-ring formation protein FlgA
MRPSLPAISRSLLLGALVALLLVLQAVAAPLALPAELRVGRQGVWLNELFPGDSSLPAVRVAEAPEPGKVLVLSRAQIADALRGSAAELSVTNFTGSAQVRVSRRVRRLEEAELLAILTETLQNGQVRDTGQLELKLSRPWPGASIPDEPFTVKFTDLPPAGLQSRNLLRFELRGEQESLGTFTVTAEAKVWEEVWIARTTLPRSLPIRDADLVRERRDTLTLRAPLAQFAADEERLELSENVSAGSPIYARMVRPRPVIRRGKLVDAIVADGVLNITLRVEALDDGAPGQVVRARNLKSKREIRGKVKDEQTIIISL